MRRQLETVSIIAEGQSLRAKRSNLYLPEIEHFEIATSLALL
jgi:hypothetical protein